MRVLFLDFDGVLNSHDWWDRRGPWRTGGGLAFEFDPVAIGRLNRICDAGVDVVVSSSWRHGRTVDELRELLAGVGFTGNVIDKTGERATKLPDRVIYSACARGIEISDWLAGRFVLSYAVVDDDSDAGYGHAERFIKTKMAVGLTDDDVVKLRLILFPSGAVNEPR